MVRSKQVVEVDVELELTIEFLDPGEVEIVISGFKANMEPGDVVTLVLQPAKQDRDSSTGEQSNQPNPIRPPGEGGSYGIQNESTKER